MYTSMTAVLYLHFLFFRCNRMGCTHAEYELYGLLEHMLYSHLFPVKEGKILGATRVVNAKSVNG